MDQFSTPTDVLWFSFVVGGHRPLASIKWADALGLVHHGPFEEAMFGLFDASLVVHHSGWQVQVWLKVSAESVG